MEQMAIFPMRNLRVTQGERSSYSHAGSLAQDHGGAAPNTNDAVFAPFDGTVMRVRQDSSHETYFVSDGAVRCPNGYVGVVTMTLMHDNVLNVKEGQHLRQGEKLGDKGGFGGGHPDAFARHSHIEVSRGVQTRQVRNTQGTWCTPEQMSLQDVFFISPDTKIIKDGGYRWTPMP